MRRHRDVIGCLIGPALLATPSSQGAIALCSRRPDVGAFVSVNRIDFGMFAGWTDGVNELIAELAPR
jgi:hypothetical protein